MRVVDIVLGQCIRAFPPAKEQQTDLVRMHHIFRKFEERYGFLQGPRVVADYNFETGITFLHGQFERNTIINTFKLFSNGILAEAKASTDDIDLFMDDVLSWAKSEMGLSIRDEHSRAYLSQIEIHTNAAIEKVFPEFFSFGQEIGKTVRSYGQNAESFGIFQINFHIDLANTPIPRPGVPFIFARREGKPFESSIYFTSAPLRSGDHLRFLAEFEKLLVDRAAMAKAP